MQKFTFSTAIAALVTFIAFLAACGEGEPNNLSNDSEQLDVIRKRMDELAGEGGRIESCAGKGPEEGGCPNEEARACSH